MNSIEQNKHVDGVAGLQKRRMSKWSIAFFVFALTASGAFGIEDIIPASGPGMTMIMLIVIPIIWAIPICMVLSELSAFMPREMGVYVWIKEAFGEMWGFIIGWAGALSTFLGSAAYVVLVVGYISKYLDLSPGMAMAIKVAMVLIFTFVNLMGTHDVALLDAVLSIIILAAFAIVTIVGFSHWQFNPVSPIIPPGQTVFGSIGMGIAIGIWMYCGYGAVTSIAGEISNPEDIPKGFKIGIIMITISYVLPTLAGLASTGPWSSWGTSGGAGVKDYSSVLTDNLGTVWGVIFMVIACISQCTIFNSMITAGSRGFFVLADDHLCPRFLTKLSKKRKQPYWAILLLAIVTLIMMNLNFDVILVIIAPLGIVTYVVLVLAFVKLRKKYPIDERGDVYHVKGGTPAVIYLTAGPVIVGILVMWLNGVEYFLLGSISILSGLIFYLLFKWLYGGVSIKDPLHYPLNPKTRLTRGDIPKAGGFLMMFGLFMLIGSLFISWQQGDVGPAMYKEMYGSGLRSDFWAMIRTSAIEGAIAEVIGVILFFVGRKIDPADKDIPPVVK